MYKKIAVYIENDLAATIMIDVEEDYVNDIGTSETLCVQVAEFVGEIIQKKSIQNNLQ
jgi:hypothetical protein